MQACGRRTRSFITIDAVGAQLFDASLRQALYQDSLHHGRTVQSAHHRHQDISVSVNLGRRSSCSSDTLAKAVAEYDVPEVERIISAAITTRPKRRDIPFSLVLDSMLPTSAPLYDYGLYHQYVRRHAISGHERLPPTDRAWTAERVTLHRLLHHLTPRS